MSFGCSSQHPERPDWHGSQRLDRGEKQAAKAVTEDDAGRAAYLKQFYGVDSELPTHYDLALNSDSLSTGVIAQLIVRAALAD